MSSPNASVPDNPAGLTGLARVLAGRPNAAAGDAEQAILLAERAVQLTGESDPAALDALARAYAASGRFEEAIATAANALESAAALGMTELETGVRARLQLFLRRQPYREAPRGR